MPAAERAEVFAETADRKGLADAIVEKDFWVCWVLKQLFSIETLSGRLLFKGGTSLSKVFHAINRFSEDIDLAVDYVALGFTGERDPRREDISKTKRDAWSLHVSDQDPNVVQFRYSTASAKGLDYLNPQVVLELGTHAEFVPHDGFTIRAFAAEEFPNVVADGDVAVVALLAKRTFWEKVTILHAEYHRPPEKPLRDRYSRHYYDVAMLADGPFRAESLADMTLLSQVVSHKETFYP